MFSVLVSKAYPLAGRLPFRMKSQGKALRLRSSHKRGGKKKKKTKNFTWGTGTYPQSSNSPQAGNLIYVKKYLLNGKMLSTAALKTIVREKADRKKSVENTGTAASQRDFEFLFAA